MRTELLTLLICFYSFCSVGQITFKTLPTPVSNTLLGISFADTNVGYACGDGGLVLKTIDGGNNWSKLTTGISHNLWDIKVIPNSGGKKVIAVGEENTVIKSNDGGTTWTSQSIPFLAGSFVFGIQCLDSSNYFACGGDYNTFSGAVLRTKNGGTSWTSSPVPGSVFLDKVFMFDTLRGFSVGTNTTFENGSIQKGLSGIYTTIKTSSNIVTNLWCNDSSNIVAVGVGGQIWKSTDAGSTWQDKSINTIDLYGIQFVNYKTGFACGGGPTENTILHTNDSGNTWVQVPYTFTGSFKSICIINDKVFIAGDLGRIIKANIPVTSKISTHGMDESKLLVYPNPAHNKLFIKSLENSKNSKFKMYDELGRLVLESKVDQSSMELNIEFIQNGNYIYSFEQNMSVIQTGKITIVK